MKLQVLIVFVLIYYQCFTQTTTAIDTIYLDTIFIEAPGTFVLYDLKNDDYRVYNIEKAKTPYAVHSTSKILWSIIGLEEGLIQNADEITKWDSIKYPKMEGWPEGWAKDQNIVSALNGSVNWYYQELLGNMTPEMIEQYLNKLDYQPGFKVEKVHYFGLTFNIKKSAFEQIDFLKHLYFNDFGISDTTVKTVKKGLLVQQNSHYTLYAKTGLGPIDDNNAIGWYIGIIEKGNDLYFFACNVITADELKAARLRIDYSLKALKALGLI
jgi:bla regulator protein blaR1